jgi:hypothetical protein
MISETRCPRKSKSVYNIYQIFSIISGQAKNLMGILNTFPRVQKRDSCVYKEYEIT